MAVLLNSEVGCLDAETTKHFQQDSGLSFSDVWKLVRHLPQPFCCRYLQDLSPSSFRTECGQGQSQGFSQGEGHVVIQGESHGFSQERVMDSYRERDMCSHRERIMGFHRERDIRSHRERTMGSHSRESWVHTGRGT